MPRNLRPGATDALDDPERNWARSPESRAYEGLTKLLPVIFSAFKNKDEQQTRIEEYWNIYNAQPDDNQQYAGNSSGYVPAVRDAINARAKRVLKQLFPQNGRHLEGTREDGDPPHGELALLEHYIRSTGLKSIVRSDLIAGDVSGQWNLMVDWTKSRRTITKLVRRNPIFPGDEPGSIGLESPQETEESTTDETIEEEGPDITDFATEDLAVIPPTCNDLQQAKAVVIRLRLSKEALEAMEDEGAISVPEGMEIDDLIHAEYQPERNRTSPPKQRVRDAGVKTDGTWKHAVVYCCYTRLPLGDEEESESISFFCGPDVILGILKNPLWSGKRPILSRPVERVQGSFFGRSKIEPVKFLQWNLTDFWNMGQDSAMYSLLPIWAVDPLKTPQWASLVMGLAAVWPVSPGDVKPITAPQLWKDAAQICDLIKRQIWESLDVNEMMMGRMPQGRKNNQLMGAMMQEQSVNISDHAARYEEVILNPLVEMMFELDQQYRTKPLMVEQRGEPGYRASLKEIPVPQWEHSIRFRWIGTEVMLGAQRMQQQIAFMNVLKSIPPQLLNGKTLDLSPILETGTENVYGPELAPRILVDQREQYTVPAEIEDEMLHNGFDVPTHPADNDVQHLQDHMRAAGLAGDPQGKFKGHMAMHMQQLQKKREAQMASQQPKGLPGGPGGGPGTVAPPGVAGAPRPGALPAPQRGMQNPPGTINADQMADGNVMGRG